MVQGQVCEPSTPPQPRVQSRITALTWDDRRGADLWVTYVDVIRSAEAAYRAGVAPLNAVEGFIRQVLGWREYVRGIYWMYMPEYLDRNALKATAPLPDFYWTGETDMNCLRQAIGQTLDHGYAHHIQRLMVTGLFSLLLGGCGSGKSGSGGGTSLDPDPTETDPPGEVPGFPFVDHLDQADVTNGAILFQELFMVV